MIDIDLPYFHPMLSGIDDNLRRLIESHGHTIQQGRGKHIGVMAFDLGRHIDQQCKTHGMAFRESIAAKTFQLFKNPLGKLFLITLGHHP